MNWFKNALKSMDIKDEVRKSLNRSRARGALKSVDPYSEHAH